MLPKIILEILEQIYYLGSSMPKKKRYSFNPVQIKDGWIVTVRKDGTIKSQSEPYIVKHTQQLKPKSER